MKVLVTGIAGFIGSKLATALIEKGYKVIGVDDFSTGFKKKCSITINYDRGRRFGSFDNREN